MQQNRILRERVAGQSAMAAVVRAQSSARRPGRLARIFGVSPLTAEARPFYRGALGELLVGDVLENLGPTWDVLHDLPLDSSIVDHLLIGRAGVFTVRAANYGRNDVVINDQTLSVGGEERDDIACAIAEASDVARILTAAAGRPVRVRPLFVVVDPRRLVVKEPARGLRVIPSSDLERTLAFSARTLTGEEVAHISDLADLVSTWPTTNAGSEGAALDTQQLHRDFGTIRTSVDDALVRRVLWASAATIVVYAGVCSVISTLVTMVVNS